MRATHPLTLPPDLFVPVFFYTALSPFQAVESLTSIRAGVSDATGSATGQGIAGMHRSAKVEVDPIMPAWPTCRGLPINATPDQTPDSEPSSDGYEDIVQVLQDNDACEFDDSSTFEVQVKGNLRKNFHFWRGIGASPFILSVIEEGYKLPFFAFPEPALEHAEFVEIALKLLFQSGRVIRCGVPPFVVNPLSVSVQAIGKKRLNPDFR